MRKSEQGLLVTHVGSLPRGARLNELLIRAELGEGVASAELEAEVERRVAHVFGQQRDLGIDICNDGEQGRVGFQTYVAQRMAGFGGQSNRRRPRDMTDFPDYGKLLAERFPRRGKQFNAPQAVAEVRYRDTTAIDAEVARLARHAKAAGRDPADCFMTAPSPGIIAAAMKNEHYDSEEAYLAAVATAIQVEYEAIVKSGFLLQLDCPDLALEGHLTYNDRPIGEFLGFVERVVAAINKAIVNVPRDRVRLHVCWGNYEGPHDRDVPLADILPILQRANVGGFVLPFANPRHQHEYRVLQKFPLADDQIIAAGVIDDLTGFVEHPEVVADRLENVARAVGDPRRVMACTDCGFDTSAGMGRVTEDVVWAKLAAMAEGARIATQRLF